MPTRANVLMVLQARRAYSSMPSGSGDIVGSPGQIVVSFPCQIHSKLRPHRLRRKMDRTTLWVGASSASGLGLIAHEKDNQFLVIASHALSSFPAARNPIESGYLSHADRSPGLIGGTRGFVLPLRPRNSACYVQQRFLVVCDFICSECHDGRHGEFPLVV